MTAPADPVAALAAVLVPRRAVALFSLARGASAAGIAAEASDLSARPRHERAAALAGALRSDRTPVSGAAPILERLLRDEATPGARRRPGVFAPPCRSGDTHVRGGHCSAPAWHAR